MSGRHFPRDVYTLDQFEAALHAVSTRSIPMGSAAVRAWIGGGGGGMLAAEIDVPSQVTRLCRLTIGAQVQANVPVIVPMTDFFLPANPGTASAEIGAVSSICSVWFALIREFGLGGGIVGGLFRLVGEGIPSYESARSDACSLSTSRGRV